MPGWQRFYEAHRSDDFELISIAVDHVGPEAPQPYVEAAGASFPTVVDQHSLLSRRLGFKVVPNGVLLDRDGTMRWAKYGGFSVENADDVSVVERFIAGKNPGPSPTARAPYALGALEQELVETKIALGHAVLALGRTNDAAASWRDALHLDPENFTIRKQIWAIEHPERFHPAIDFDWQKERLTKERAEEVAAGICGPDGCPLPYATAAGTEAG